MARTKTRQRRRRSAPAASPIPDILTVARLLVRPQVLGTALVVLAAATLPYLLPLTVGALVVAVGALALRATRRHGYGPLALGLVGAVLFLVGKFVAGSDAINYGGIGLLIVASGWNSWPKKRTPSNLRHIDGSCTSPIQEGE